MISSISETVVSFLQNPIVKLILYGYMGWTAHQLYLRIFSSKSIGKSKVELVNMMIAHQIVARSAIAFLDKNQKQALEDAVKNELDESFIDEIGFDVK